MILRVWTACVVMLLAWSTPAQAVWLKSVSTGFIVYSESSEKEIQTQIEKLEKFDTYLRSRYGITTPPPMKLTIFILKGENAVARLTGSANKDIRGYYTSGPNGPMAVSVRTAQGSKFGLDSDTILFHEYAHHFMYQYMPGAYPLWYSEGFAEFYATADFDAKGRLTIGKPPYFRGNDLFLGAQLSIRDVLEAERSQLNREEVADLYGRAWLLTHYMMVDRPRRLQLAKYIDLLAAGQENLDAATEAFGDLDALSVSLKAYLSRSNIPVSQSMDPVILSAPITTEKVEPGEAASMIDRLKLMSRADEESLTAIITSLQSARTAYPQSLAVRQLLAQAYWQADKVKEADAEASAALVLSPSDSHSLLYKGKAQIRLLEDGNVSDAAKWKAARAFIVKANRAAPSSPFPLIDYYESYAHEGTAAPAIAFDGLEMAFSVMPQDPSLRYRYATALIKKKNYAGAARIIKPLVYSPHDDGNVAHAKRMLTALEKAIKSGKDYDAEFNALVAEATPSLFNKASFRSRP